MRVDFIIDGAAVGAASGSTFTRHEPVTGAVASEAAAAGEADVASVIEAAHRAFPAWSQTGPSRAEHDVAAPVARRQRFRQPGPDLHVDRARW